MKEIGKRSSGEQRKPMESSERRQPLRDLPRTDSIEITGPVKMKPEQNFYDQFPFKTVIENASKHTGITQSDLRYLLNRYVHASENPELQAERERS